MFGIFKRKNENVANSGQTLTSAEYERCLKRIVEAEAELKTIKKDYEVLETDVANLRGQFNRKLRGLSVEEKKTEENEKSYKEGDVLYLGEK